MAVSLKRCINDHLLAAIEIASDRMWKKLSEGHPAVFKISDMEVD